MPLTQAVTATWSQRDATAHVRVCTEKKQTVERERERATPGKKVLKTKDWTAFFFFQIE